MSQAEKKILIIGDLIVDKTYHVDALKISPEAPVPVAYLRQAEPIKTAGGASLAAAYAQKHGLPCTFLTAATRENKLWLKDIGLDVHCFDVDRNVTKIRYIDIASGYHLLRLDNDNVVEPPTTTPDSLVASVVNILDKHDIGIIAVLDYRKGMFDSPEACQALISLCNERSILFYVDTRDRVEKSSGTSILKLNTNEFAAACAALHVDGSDQLIQKLKLNHVIITQGAEGAILMEGNGGWNATPDLTKFTGTPDVTGCGDVFDVNFCYNWGIKQRTLRESLRIAVDKATEFAYSSIKERLRC